MPDAPLIGSLDLLAKEFDLPAHRVEGGEECGCLQVIQVTECETLQMTKCVRGRLEKALKVRRGAGNVDIAVLGRNAKRRCADEDGVEWREVLEEVAFVEEVLVGRLHVGLWYSPSRD